MQLVIDHISKKIKHNPVLQDISLKLEGGRIYGLKGKNGSGKTMLLKAVCGLIFTDEGTIAVDGKIIGKDMDFPPSVGILIEYPGFVEGYSARRNLEDLAQIRGIVGRERIDEVLEQVGLAEAGRKKFRQYSLGMKQKLGIAAAVMENPDLILLDEPTNALDHESVQNLRKILIEQRERGALILIASHDEEELRYLADKIYLMENGRVYGVEE